VKSCLILAQPTVVVYNRFSFMTPFLISFPGDDVWTTNKAMILLLCSIGSVPIYHLQQIRSRALLMLRLVVVHPG